MIVGRSVDNINDAFEFTYQTPLRGLREIDSLIDDITGELVDRFFIKHFKFSYDGVRYNDDWIELSLVNLQQNIHDATTGLLPIRNDIVVKFRYIRKGTNISGTLTLNSLIIGGVYSMEYLQVLDFENTVYSNIAWTDEYWNRVWLNLMKKTHESGMIPTFMPRGEEDNWDDADYVVLWKSLSYFFALQIALVNDVITELINRPKLLGEYLHQRSILTCGNEDLSYLQWIAQNAYDVSRKRGTIDIVKQDGDHILPVLNPRHGEMLRLICYNVSLDEFLFEYVEGGITIDLSWPTYYGLTNHLQLNKSPENTQDVLDLGLYNTSGSVSLVTDGSKEVVQLSGSSEIELIEIKVDDGLDYEFTFMASQPTLPGGTSMSVLIECIDEGGFTLSVVEIETGSTVTEFVSGYNFPMANHYYPFKGLMFRESSSLIPTVDSTLDIGSGRHVRLPVGTKRVKLKVTFSGAGELNLWDIKMKPTFNQQISTFINGIDSTNIWLKNNNLRFTNRSIEQKIREYLIPSNSTLQVNFLS